MAEFAFDDLTIQRFDELVTGDLGDSVETTTRTIANRFTRQIVKFR
jgi:hypothetical protein